MRKNILYALSANLVNAGFSWVLLFYIIRFGSIEDVGVFGLAQAVSLPIYMFFTLKLRTIQLSDFIEEFSAGTYIFSGFLLSVFNFIVCLSVAFLLYFENKEMYYSIVLLSGGYSVMIFREYYFGVVQKNERSEFVLVSNLVYGVFNVVLFIIIYNYTDKLSIALTAQFFSRFILLFLDSKILIKYFSVFLCSEFFKFESNNVITLMKRGLPLGIAALVGTLFTSIPRIKLESYSSVELLGVFTTLMSIVFFYSLFISSVTQAVLPKFSKIYMQSEKVFIRKFTAFFIIAIFFLSLLVLFTYFFSNNILGFIFGYKYIDYGFEFFIANISAVLLCAFHLSNMMLNAQKSYTVQMYLYVVCAILAIIYSYYFIPRFNLIGAIYTTMLISVSGVFLNVIAFKIYMRGDIDV